MGIGFQMKRRLSISLFSIALAALSSTTLFAGETEKFTWSTILPEESNLSLQQQQVINSLEITLKELGSVMDSGVQDKKISNDTDFTISEDVTLVYDFLMYRIYEVIKVDRRIKEEFATEEISLKSGETSSDIVRRHFTTKEDYERKGTNFFSSLENLRRAVYIKDLRAGVKTLQNSIRDLRSAMNLYSSYRITVAAR